MAVNRKARSGAADLSAVIDSLADALGPAEIIDIDDPRNLRDRLAASISTDVERIVIAGGDGTVNAALPVLLETGRPFGVIPLGTANDFARTLGIPADPAEAAAVIVAGKTRRIDVGIVNGRPFLNAAGLGFSTGLHAELPPWLKRTFGPLAYPIGVVRRWRRHRPFSVFIDDDMQTAKRVIQVTVANGRFYGGGMTAHQDASIDDAYLDVVMVFPTRWWRHASSVVRLKRGVYADDAAVSSERRTRFRLSTRRPMSIATDGEPSTSTPARFDVLPGALEVFAP